MGRRGVREGRCNFGGRKMINRRIRDRFGYASQGVFYWPERRRRRIGDRFGTHLALDGGSLAEILLGGKWDPMNCRHWFGLFWGRVTGEGWGFGGMTFYKKMLRDVKK